MNLSQLCRETDSGGKNMESDWPKAWPNVMAFVNELYTFYPNGDVLLQLVCCPKKDVPYPSDFA